MECDGITYMRLLFNHSYKKIPKRTRKFANLNVVSKNGKTVEPDLFQNHNRKFSGNVYADHLRI